MDDIMNKYYLNHNIYIIDQQKYIISFYIIKLLIMKFGRVGAISAI